MKSSFSLSKYSSAEDENSISDNSLKRHEFLATYHRNQQWLLPDSIIYHITKNPLTSKAYEKMIQSCKHFFIQKPLLVIYYLEHQSVGGKTKFEAQYVDLNKLSSKLWITNQLYFDNYGSIQNSLSFIVPKIYQCDIDTLHFWSQNIFIDDLKFVASKCEKIMFNESTVFNVNESVVGMEKIFEVLPSIKEFFYYFDSHASAEIITSKNLKELIQIPHFLNLNDLFFTNIPDTFDINTFYDYIKNNKKTTITLQFCHYISQEYQNILRTIVNEIIATKNRDFKAPSMNFRGIGLSASKSLSKLSMEK